jgi:hypothetical protein
MGNFSIMKKLENFGSAKNWKFLDCEKWGDFYGCEKMKKFWKCNKRGDFLGRKRRDFLRL